MIFQWALDGKVVNTCGTGDEADFWFITNYANTTLAEVIYVEIQAGHKRCDDPENGNFVPCHSNDFEVYIYPGEYMLKIEEVASYFKPLHKITNKTLPTTALTKTTQTFSFNGQNYSQGLTLGFRSRGACGSIFRIKMYYYYCEETISEGIKFERTVSPAKEFKNVTGNCSENSMSSNNVTSVYRSCYRNGTWGKLEDGNLECFCVEGYEPNKTEGSCSSKLHLLIVINS